MAMAAAEQATGIGMDVSKNISKNLSYCSSLLSWHCLIANFQESLPVKEF